MNLKTIASAALTGVFSLPLLAQTSTKPNFVVILVDDVGFADFSCYGGAIPTPNIDKLAQNGVRMSQMYNCARCCPTRASLLTGLYPQQAGVGHMTADLSKESSNAYQGYLNNSCVTLAEVMNTNGYFTAMTGKWHVGQDKGVTPKSRGFMRSLNSPAGGFYFAGPGESKLFLDGINIKNDDVRLPENWYSTDLWTQFGLQFINEAISAKKPFMLYLAYNAAHFPLQAPAKDIARFKGKFSKGWDLLRQECYQRQLDMNLLGKPYGLTKRNPLIPKWDDLDAAQKLQSEHIMEIFAAVVDKLDQNIGKLVNELKAKGVYNNTVIILLSDNGGNAEGKDVFGTFNGENPGAVGSTVFLGQAWAETSNTPFYLYKHHTHEGGISAPCVVSFPNGIPASQNGKIVKQPGHVIDIMATLVGMSGAQYPKTFNGNDITPMQGINLFPIWKSETVIRKEPIFWEHEANVALRDDKWKLVKENHEDNFQLYDMDKDRTELNDLSKKELQVFSKMMEKYETKYNTVGAMPLKFKEFRWFVPINKY
ncbi:MAG: arylsulfatase [Bacteroidia bacterium]|nr:arylsulfatase [Bacteroidia bacterium]